MGDTMSQSETTHSPTIEQLQKLHRRRMALFGLVILIAGIAIGAASTVILMPRPKGFPGPDDPSWAGLMMAGRLEHVLDLAPEQKEKIRLICETAFKTLREIQEKAKPEVDAVIKEMNDNISAALTDEQRQRWQRELEEFQRRFHEGWRRGGRPSGEGGPGGRRGPGEGGQGPRGPGEPDQYRRGPDDPNRPPREFDGPPRGERFGEDRGQFGRGRRQEDANLTGDDFGGEPGRDRFRGRPGPFGPGSRRQDPNSPPLDMNSDPAAEPNRPGK